MPLVTLTRDLGPIGKHGHAPPERRLVGDRGEVVRTGLEQRHPALQELVAREVAVVVGVRRRRCDVVDVDQPHEVFDRFGRLRVVPLYDAA